MTQPDPAKVFEIGVSYRYAQEHDWVVHAITGFLSAYYMEEPQFRVTRRFHELETGMHVWKCEAPKEKIVGRLLKRLQADIPDFHLYERHLEGDGIVRKVIDLPNSETSGS